jgi:hypothetical protein
MERCCSTGQSPQRAVAPTEEEEVLLLSVSVVRILTMLTDTNRTSMKNTYCVYTVSRFS